MLNNLKEYWYLWLALLIMCAVMVFVWYHALRAGSKRNRRRRMELERMDRHHRLKKEFSHITADVLARSQDIDLLDGVTEHLMDLLEHAQDDVKLFRTFSPEQKYIYTLSFVKDLAVGDSVRRYYRECGEILGEYTAPAFSALGQPALAEFFQRATQAYDEKNCAVSADEASIARMEEEFRRLMDGVELDLLAAAYIRLHAEAFCKDTGKSV